MRASRIILVVLRAILHDLMPRRLENHSATPQRKSFQKETFLTALLESKNTIDFSSASRSVGDAPRTSLAMENMSSFLSMPSFFETKCSIKFIT